MRFRSTLQVVVLALCSFTGCASQSKAAWSPRCEVRECCSSGWVFNGLACQVNAPPFCGCFCSTRPPEVFSTEQACAEANAHRGLFHAAQRRPRETGRDAGVGGGLTERTAR